MTRLRYIFTLIALATTLWISAHTYVSESVLASGSFHKISVRESGLYSLSFDDIRKMGLDPATLQIYGFGGAMLSQDFRKVKIDDLPLVPYLRLQDKVVFYGQGSVSWNYTGARFERIRNPYSDLGYYFLTSGTAAGEITNAPTQAGSSQATVTTFTAHLLHERDSVNLIDRNGGKAGGGREFYGESFKAGETRTFKFTFPNAILSTSMQCYMDAAAYRSTGTTASFTFKCDQATYNVTPDVIKSNEFYDKAKTVQINKTMQSPVAEATKTVTLTYNSSAPTSWANLNYIVLTAQCPLAMPANGQPLYFRTTDGYRTSSVLTYELSGASAETEIWDITSLDAIKRVSATLNGSTLTFMATNNAIHEYVAFNPSATTYMAPADLGKIANQNLHALQDIDMVIISPAAFLSEAQRLGAAHQEHDAFTVAVVTDQQVYNEFSSGTPDATAYRWLMKMLYDRANASSGAIQKPRYLLLFGDGTFDNRKLLPASGNNWLLTYQAKNSVHEVHAYATDDYFAFLDDNEGESDISGRMDISVGRLPVNTEAEATAIVNKLIRHMQPNRGRWKTQTVFLADDDDHTLHTECTDSAARKVQRHCPDIVVNKIYLDSYTQEVNASGESYPLAEARLNNLLASGVQLFDYCGHSGYNNATSEGLVSIASIRAMKNENLGLWMFASCSFAHFDALNSSAAEEAVLNPDGGALAVCAANRTVYANQNMVLNYHICDSLFAHRDPFTYPHRIGDAVRLGKNACGSDENKMSYLLLGDPASSLHLPAEYQVVTTSLADTINALSINDLKGYISTQEGDTASFFNGKLFFTVYDKKQLVTTLDNDVPAPDEKKTMTFEDYPNILFQGEAKVENGTFTATFMTPKDIRYNYGNGRIVFYAYDEEYGDEAMGHFHDFVIGGSSPVALVDTIGPDIRLYLNSPSFVSGDQTNETPHFFAEISDEHGINTAGSGIGHDLILVVDDNPQQTYVLNDYFTATSGYQSGLVSYGMQELSEGQHSLFFRAWDLLNNTSSATLDFTVVKGLQPDIMSVMCYPNPIASDGQLTIEIDHTAPDLTFETSVFIYDMSGRLVETIKQRGTEPVRWDLNNTPTPAGVYLYKVQLESASTKAISKPGKLIITH